MESDAGYHEPRAGEVYQIGGARIEVVHPVQVTGDLNNGSIVVRIVHGDISFLMTGDAEAEAEHAMLRREQELTAQVVKLGHHGSRTSSTVAFLQAVQPEVAIYSAEHGNPYGHPHIETLQMTAALDIPVYGTDVFGTIQIATDGREYVVVTARDGSVGRVGTVGTNVLAPRSGVADAAASEDVGVDPALTSTCPSSLIDINTATVGELERIIHIGPALANRIVDARPFVSVADLVRVSGIAERRLQDIVEQGLACVDTRD